MKVGGLCNTAGAVTYEFGVLSVCMEPRLRGLPEGLLDQPFYGWVTMDQAAVEPHQRGFLLREFEAVKALPKPTA